MSKDQKAFEKWIKTNFLSTDLTKEGTRYFEGEAQVLFSLWESKIAPADAKIKELRNWLKLIMDKCTDHDGYSYFDDYKELVNNIISIIRKALGEK